MSQEQNEQRSVKMHKNYLHVNLVAPSLSLDFKVYHPVELHELRGRFFLLFAKEFDADNKKIIIDEIQTNTPELRKAVLEFVTRYREELPVINKMNEYFSKLKEGEKFTVIPYVTLDQIEHYKVTKHLVSLESGSDFDTLWKESVDKFGEMLENYEFHTFDEDTRKRIGEQDKTRRVCRFCSNKRDKVSFKVNAHAISEALGNKRIYLNEECDECNESFGKGIEKDLIAFSRIYLSFTGIRGKKGVAKTKGKNFTLSNDSQIVLDIGEDNFANRKAGSLESVNYRLETNEKISQQNIYRILCKFALSVINTKHISKFSKTIDWITNNAKITLLPKIACRLDPDISYAHPSITVFLRKEDKKRLPLLVAELRMSVLRFVYIVPAFTNEELDFTDESNYADYWKAFKHYSSTMEWRFDDFSNDDEKDLIFMLNFQIGNSEVGNEDKTYPNEQ